jgi:DHA2 family integral membrane protein (MFS transporter)
VIGSVFSSVYANALHDGRAFSTLPAPAQHAAQGSVGAAQQVAGHVGAAAPAFLADVSNAFLAGLSVACLVVAGVALVGALVAWRFLPARAQAASETEEPLYAESLVC